MRLGLTAAYAAIVLLLGSLIFATAASAAQSGPKAAPTATIAVQQLPPISSPQDNFDPLKATNAYLAQVSGEARARSDSYFEGGYILLFVNAFYAVLVSAILLWLHISARIRNIARGITRSRFWQVPIYVLLYMPLATAMAFPLTVYENYLREHAYGLSNQTFVQWLGDFGKDFALTIVILTVGLTVIYAVIRAARRTWWIWGTLVAVGFLAFGTLVGPVFIAPLFNHYQPLQEGPLKARILSLARAEGIPARNVYEFDASRQTNRISANVSGLFGTTRISLNDNLINRCTPDEVIAVFGHEMGHYVLNHAAILITWFGLLLLVGFAFVDWGFGVLANVFGGNWDVRTIDDPAGLPVITALLSVFMLVATPVSNTITRTTEAQADIFGVNAVRQPDGFAKAVLMLSEYRKLDPTPLEEFLFYDHPSGRSRIAMMMRWKAGHLNDFDIRTGPVSPQ
ncbi:MAG: M48 family metallopeptidase [Rhizomicrobium sp.]